MKTILIASLLIAMLLIGGACAATPIYSWVLHKDNSLTIYSPGEVKTIHPVQVIIKPGLKCIKFV